MVKQELKYSWKMIIINVINILAGYYFFGSPIPPNELSDVYQTFSNH